MDWIPHVLKNLLKSKPAKSLLKMKADAALAVLNGNAFQALMPLFLK